MADLYKKDGTTVSGEVVDTADGFVRVEERTFYNGTWTTHKTTVVPKSEVKEIRGGVEERKSPK